MKRQNASIYTTILLSIGLLLGLLISMEFVLPRRNIQNQGERDVSIDTTPSSSQATSQYEKPPLPNVDVYLNDAPNYQKTVHTTEIHPKALDTKRAQVFIVLDDAGASRVQLQAFLSLDIPLTVAVLPHLSESKAVAELVHQKKHAVFLHLPLEPLGNQNPGRGAIYVGNTAQSIAQTIEQNLASVPHAIGANNHMGSRVTTDSVTLRHVLASIQRQNLQFLDSRTTAESKVVSLAHDLDLMVSVRDIFLDHHRDEAAMEAAFYQGLDRAREQGKSILIGHVTVPELAAVLRKHIPIARTDGFQFLSMEQYHTE